MLRRHPNLSLATALYCAALVWLTLTPSANTDLLASVARRIARELRERAGVEWVGSNHVEFVANIVLFMPLGVLVVLLLGRRRWWFAIVAGVLASCWIELAQDVWLTSRVADPRDLMANGIGTVIGVAFALLVTWPAARRSRVASASGTARHAGA